MVGEITSFVFFGGVNAVRDIIARSAISISYSKSTSNFFAIAFLKLMDSFKLDN